MGDKDREPSADLAVAMAILSSFKNKPINSKTAVFGELGLLGEVRSIERRTGVLRRQEVGFYDGDLAQDCENIKTAELSIS